MRIAVWLTYLSVLVLGLSACDEKTGSSKSGTLRLTLAADTASLHKGINSGITKTVSDEFASFLTTDDYRVMILSGTDTTKSYDRFDRMPSEVELPEGAYTLIAAKGDDLPAEFENPYFEGRTTFTVKEEMSTPLEVTATLGNARITAAYTDDFREAYSDYTVLLSSAYTTSDLEIAKGETRPAYMQVAPGGTDIAIGIRLKKITEETEKTYYVPTPLTLERRQNVRLIFKTDGEALEGIGLEVVLDDEMVEYPIMTKIPDFMWEQFTKPTLTAEGFEDGATLAFKDVNENLMVSFAMPAGIGSLSVKQWMGDDEDEAEIIDLVANPGEAINRHFSWMVGENENPVLKEVRKPGYILLENAIRSLPASKDEELTYHFVFFGTDASGKHNPTEPEGGLHLNVVVPKAENPTISGFDLSQTLVDGDFLKQDVTAVLNATGGIDEENSKLMIQSEDGATPVEISIMDQSAWVGLKDYGIYISSENKAQVAIEFKKEMALLLPAPESGGSSVYTIKIHLEDNNGLVAEQEQQIIVEAPVFELTTTEGDAFAKRIILRADMAKGSKEKLSFRYKETDASEWITYEGSIQSEETNQYIGTLTGLMPTTSYQVQALYKGVNTWESKVVEVVTEEALALEDGSFENWYSEKVYSNKTAWVGIDIYQWWPFEKGGTSWWTTRNALTNSQNSGATCYYTSYSGTVPVDNGYDGKAVEISSLGFGEGSTYSQTLGWKAKKRAAGMLFIGSHSASPGGDSESFDYGHEFVSRPTGFKFNYKFKSINSESFKAYIVIENRNQGEITELGRGEFVSNLDQATFVEAKVGVKYSNTFLEATHMYIVFISSTESNPGLDVIKGNIDEWNGNADSRFVGNVLTVDNVELIYE